MKNFVFTLFLFTSLSLVAQKSKKVFGTVSDGNKPIENVNVTILEKDILTTTDSEGKYEIQVVVGDKIQYTYTGMRVVTIRVEDVTRVLNPILIPEITELNEVVVEASRRRTQNEMEEDYPLNRRIIKTAWGYLDADRAAGSVRMLSEDEINPISLCILDLLKSRFPGVRAYGNCSGTEGAVIIRGATSIYNSSGAIFDVDGQIFTNIPWWIDVVNIKRLAILANLASTAPYGNLGRGGVVVINTVNGNHALTKIVDRARLKNNFADGKELSRFEVAKNAPVYLKEFINSGSFENSKAVFDKHLSIYANSPYFLLDTYSHFVEKYDAVDYADGIIEEHFGLYSGNPVLMKALAYTYESQERYDMANEVYKEVFILRPNYSQSYMDMANSYRNIDEHKQAASMYTRHEYLIEESFLERDTLGFGPIMEREFNNLLMLNKRDLVDSKKVEKVFVAEEDFKGTRLVFEWNDGEAEFDLQFVNPKNQYYKWKHSIFDSADEIEREKDFGYNVKEYLLDSALPGIWKINVNYLGNKSLTPSYLKATIYHNYGSRTQSKEVKVFKLDLKNVNQELFRLTTGSGVVVR